MVGSNVLRTCRVRQPISFKHFWCSSKAPCRANTPTKGLIVSLVVLMVKYYVFEPTVLLERVWERSNFITLPINQSCCFFRGREESLSQSRIMSFMNEFRDRIFTRRCYWPKRSPQHQHHRLSHRSSINHRPQQPP